jgi:hypothetical protein
MWGELRLFTSWNSLLANYRQVAEVSLLGEVVEKNGRR